METLTRETFKQKIFDFESSKDWSFAGPRPAIVDFFADWCAPCRALTPVLESVAKEYAGKIDIFKVNTETDPELAALFGVRGIPAILFIPPTGEPVMTAGFMPHERFQRAIQDVFSIGPASNDQG